MVIPYQSLIFSILNMVNQECNEFFFLQVDFMNRQKVGQLGLIFLGVHSV